MPSDQLVSEEIMDNEHTVYTETTVNDKPATLWTSSNFDGLTTYYLFGSKMVLRVRW